MPLTSDTPHLRQQVLHSPVPRPHANALPTKAAQIPMALRHHERTLATRSIHTLANISHARFVRDFLQKCSGKSPKRAFRTRFPPKVKRQVSKTHSRLHFALDTHDLRRGLRRNRANRTLARISRTRHARSPQRVAPEPDKAHSRLHFVHSTHDLRRGLRAHRTNRTLACISCTRHAQSPQRLARAPTESHCHSRARHARSPQRVARTPTELHSRLESTFM